MVVKHQQGKLVDKKYLFYFTEGEIEMRNDWNIIFRKFHLFLPQNGRRMKDYFLVLVSKIAWVQTYPPPVIFICLAVFSQGNFQTLYKKLSPTIIAVSYWVSSV